MLQINFGDIVLKNPFIQAPLAGFTDNASRIMASRYGAGLVVSEMISCLGIIYGQRGTEELMKQDDISAALAFQLFASESNVMAEAVALIEDEKNNIVDINMGCPAPKVFKTGAGVALMKEPEKVYDITRAAVKNTSKPVSVKLRAGIDENTVNVKECALACQEAGASAVAIHPRTRAQYYSGAANLDLIREVKEILSIKVIGNGDVKDYKDALSMMRYTGCDMVMIGRGSIGRPWIFDECNEAYEKYLNGIEIEEIVIKDVDLNFIKDKVLELAYLSIDDKGEKTAIIQLRKKIGYFFKGMHGVGNIRKKIYAATTVGDLIKILESI